MLNYVITLCDYSDAYILVCGTIIINGEGAYSDAKRANERNTGVTSKACTPFRDCIRKTNNTNVDIEKICE